LESSKTINWFSNATFNAQTLWLSIDRQKTNCRIFKEHTQPPVGPHAMSLARAPLPQDLR